VYLTDRRVWFQSRQGVNFPRHFIYNDERIWCSFTQGRHGTYERTYFMISEDGGETWLPDVKFPIDHHIHFMNRLRDGHLWCWGESGIFTEDLYGTAQWNWGQRYYEAALSWDEGKTWTVKRLFIEPNWGDITQYNNFIEMPDGTLLQAAYGHSRAPVDRQELHILSLRPDEDTWRHRAQVFPHDETLPYWQSNETALVRMPNGELVCAARTECGTKATIIAHSKDDGFTWTKTGVFEDRGCSPQMHLMANGTLLLACGARKPNHLECAVTVYTSKDGGYTWGKPFIMYDGPGSAYVCLVPTGKDRFLVTWSEGFFVLSHGHQYAAPDNLNKICAGTLVVES
jgi:hypothetical protein